MTVVAIDGPAGSGKSTIARALADRLAVPHVDTGAFYRAATLAVLRAGVDLRDEEACVRVIRAAHIARERGLTLLDGADVEAEIRGPAVTAAVSTVSAHPGVRRVLLGQQRAAVTDAGAVVEGRDAGTAVVPDAAMKVWLTATPQVRAERRAAQVGETNRDAVAAHAADLARRDGADAQQMARAPDVVEIDTTGRSVASLVDEISRLIGART
jgi:cytidylate kinase